MPICFLKNLIQTLYLCGGLASCPYSTIHYVIERDYVGISKATIFHSKCAFSWFIQHSTQSSEKMVIGITCPKGEDGCRGFQHDAFFTRIVVQCNF